MILTYPEQVTEWNLEKMRTAVENGPGVHPGANYVETMSESGQVARKMLEYGDRNDIAKKLRPGDLVERHMIDGDIVLFNRQPSLHKLSFMAHKAKILEGRTFRFNECVCTPYNADFDGDEMNLHLPQTEEARAEALILMGNKSNMCTPRNGELQIAATQDFITGIYLLTRKESFFDRGETCQIISQILVGKDASMKVDLPPPAIMKPERRWTGKQIFGMLMRPNKECQVLANLVTKGKNYTANREFCGMDSYIIVRNSEHLAGALDKSIVGSGSKTSNIFYVLLRDFGEDIACTALWRLGRVASWYLTNRGFSVGIGDVTPTQSLLEEKDVLMTSGYENCVQFIKQLEDNTLPRQAGCSAEETLEGKLLNQLSSIRNSVGKSSLTSLDKSNAPLTMSLCGAKGSLINTSQMIACVGQQAISGKRIPDGFDDRSLPHFLRNSKLPEAKGFVANSFYSGLTPTEFFFHGMAGREGLVDTAVKTAQSGYIQRRLIKGMEDICVAYDGTVRNRRQEVVQLTYGGDGFNPQEMEGMDKPVDFEHVLDQARAIHTNRREKAVHRSEIGKYVKQAIGMKSAIKMNREANKAFEDDMMEFSKQMTKSGDERVRVTSTQLTKFVELCRHKYCKAVIEAGTPVGALCAQSIGEPSTQMTLKTFHFAGVASMNVTLGVPRVSEIVNAPTKIATPMVTAHLERPGDPDDARKVKGRIERTTLGEVSEYIEEVFTETAVFILVKLDLKRIALLQLEVNAESTMAAIVRDVKEVKRRDCSVIDRGLLKIHITDDNPSQCLQKLMGGCMHSVVVRGLSSVNRAIIHRDDENASQGPTFKLFVEGDGLLNVMGTYGVDGKRCTSNNSREVAAVLGIEAGRSTIQKELMDTMGSHGIKVDRRHAELIADHMARSGTILGLTREGIAKQEDSVLQLASFEKSCNHLYKAAFQGSKNSAAGVSDSIILGKPIKLGTGLMDLLLQRGKVPLKAKRVALWDSHQFNRKELYSSSHIASTSADDEALEEMQEILGRLVHSKVTWL